MPDGYDKPATPPGSQSASALPIERKLATILSADVAEFSRLMSEDEEGTLRAFRGHKKIFESLVATHHGRVFNTAGDAILAEFSSAVEAVRCATDVQSALRTRNDKFPPNRQVRFRIGINLGDVMIQGQDLLGDGVNLAARLQTAAEPGGICIAGSVHDQIRNKLSLTFQSLGERSYKNIPQPVRTFAIAESEAGAVLPSPKAQGGVKKSAAIWAIAGIAIVAGAGYGAYAVYQHAKATNAPAVTATKVAAPAPVPAPTPAATPAPASTAAPTSSPTAASPQPAAKPKATAAVAHKEEASAPPAKKAAPVSEPEVPAESEESAPNVTSAPAPSESAEARPTPSSPAPAKPAPAAPASRPATKFMPPAEPPAAEPRPHAGGRASAAARAGEYDGVYSGDVCYGKIGALPNQCFVASGRVTGDRITGTWRGEKGVLTTHLEGHVGPRGDVVIEMNVDKPDGTRQATINMTGTIRNGTILAEGKFLKGRPANLDWHLRR